MATRQSTRAATTAAVCTLTINGVTSEMSEAASRAYLLLKNGEPVPMPAQPTWQDLAELLMGFWPVICEQYQDQIRRQARQITKLSQDLEVALDTLKQTAVETKVERDGRGQIVSSRRVPRG
jgi:hypothetical protein